MSLMMDNGILLASLDDLASLPREVIDMVIVFLDVNSATRFTQVNRQAQLLLWSRANYRFIRAVLFDRHFRSHYRVKNRNKTILTTVTVQDLADLIFTVESSLCKNCSNYGDRNLWGVELVDGHAVCYHDYCAYETTMLRYGTHWIMPTYHMVKRLLLSRDASTGQLVGKLSCGIPTSHGR